MNSTSTLNCRPTYNYLASRESPGYFEVHRLNAKYCKL